jgi:hypothetical protein
MRAVEVCVIDKRSVEVCVIDKTLPHHGRTRFLEIVLQVNYFGYIDDTPVTMIPSIVFTCTENKTVLRLIMTSICEVGHDDTLNCLHNLIVLR